MRGDAWGGAAGGAGGAGGDEGSGDEPSGEDLYADDINFHHFTQFKVNAIVHEKRGVVGYSKTRKRDTTIGHSALTRAFVGEPSKTVRELTVIRTKDRKSSSVVTKLPERGQAGFAAAPQAASSSSSSSASKARGGGARLTRCATATGATAAPPPGSAATAGGAAPGASSTGLAPSASQPLLTQSYTAFARDAAAKQRTLEAGSGKSLAHHPGIKF